MEARERTFDKDDKLDRKRYAEFLTTIIENCDNYKRDESSSYVIAIDSPWGTGKTWFVDMWLSQLKPVPNLFPIKYSAWENDFWDNAFEPLMYSLLNDELLKNSLDSERLTDAGKETVKNILRAAAHIGKGIMSGYIKQKAGEDAANLFDEFASGGFTNFKSYLTGNKALFKEYQDFANNIKELKNALANTIDLIEDTEEVQNKKLVIIIDELDRCKPTFAIQTLEIVKHIFNIKNVVFVFALDIQQLGHSIKALYGADMDSVGYLLRFFDYISKMPKYRTDKYIEFLLVNKPLNNYGLHDGGLSKALGDIFDAFVQISEQEHLSLRDINIIYASLLIFEKYEFKSIRVNRAYTFYLMLISCKYKFPDDFNKIFVYGNVEDLNAIYPLLNMFDLDRYHLTRKLSDTQVAKIDNESFDSNRYIADAERDFVHIYIRGKESGSMRPVKITIHSVINSFLFYNDLMRWDEIKNLTVFEFLHRKLELFDFTYLQQVEEKEQA